GCWASPAINYSRSSTRKTSWPADIFIPAFIGWSRIARTLRRRSYIYLRRKQWLLESSFCLLAPALRRRTSGKFVASSALLWIAARKSRRSLRAKRGKAAAGSRAKGKFLYFLRQHDCP